MNFLAPWFLAAAALVAGPVIAHLIRRITRDRVGFSATRFLEASPPRLQRRSRVQNPWLLALRCLIVALLALAFARPFFRGNSTLAPLADPTQDVVIVLDESASMRRKGLWNEARERAVRVAESLRARDRCSVLLAGSGVKTLISIEEWPQLPADERASRVRALLTSREPGWGPLFLDTAIDSALEVFADAPRGSGSRQRLVIISDFARGTRVAGLAGRDWPAGCEVSFERTFPPLTNNAGIQFIGWNETSGGAPQARVRITRDQGAPALRLNLQLRDGLSGRELGTAESIDLRPGETTVSLVKIPEHTVGPFEVVLSGDAETFDNRAWLVPTPPRLATVAYLGKHDATDPTHARFYLGRALASAPGSQVSVVEVDPQGDGNGLAAATLLVLAEVPSAEVLRAVTQRVQAGAIALVTAKDSALIQVAGSLVGESGWTVADAEPGRALLGQIDFTHPLFSLFADPRFSDFSRLRFWHAVPIALPSSSGTTVVAHFDDGSAAVLESTVGRGRVVTWGGDWSPTASQWVLSSKFVPWLQALLERALGGPPRPAYAEINQVERLTRDPAARWRFATEAADAFVSIPPSHPGLYQLRDYDGVRWVAVELPAEESRTDTLALDAFEQLGVPTKATPLVAASRPAASPIDAAALEIEGRQKLWRWLLMAVAGFLAVESLAALVAARRENQTLSFPAGG